MEYLGNLYREGHLYTQKEQRTYDHDFTSLAEGIIIPHGIYTSVALVKELIKKTRNSKGLKVAVEIIDTVYQTGRKVAEDFKLSMRIVFDSVLPLWNYRVVPNQTFV